MSFRDFIRGKRVVFVGGCPNLVNKNQGEFIDGFDVVCRSNGSMLFLHPQKFAEMPEKAYQNQADYFKDYGSRCDVLYTNNQFQRESGQHLTVLPALKTLYVRGKVFSPQVQEILRNGKIDFEVIHTAIKTVNAVVRGALMGCYIIQDLIDCKPAEIHVTGIDFFESKNQVFRHDDYREYLTGYLTPEIRATGNRINAGKLKDGHSQYHNTLFFYEKWRAGLITMSGGLENLMKKIVARGDV
jgi:hypothetical protein